MPLFLTAELTEDIKLVGKSSNIFSEVLVTNIRNIIKILVKC